MRTRVAAAEERQEGERRLKVNGTEFVGVLPQRDGESTRVVEVEPTG